MLLPVPGRGTKVLVDLEDLLDVAERPERLELGGTYNCPACGICADPSDWSSLRSRRLPWPSGYALQARGCAMCEVARPNAVPSTAVFPSGKAPGQAWARTAFELRALLLHVGEIEAGR